MSNAFYGIQKNKAFKPVIEETTIQLLNGFRTHGDEYPSQDHFVAYKIGDLVFLAVPITRAETSNSNLPAFIVPEGFRPLYLHDIKNVDASGWIWGRTWSGEFIASKDLKGKFDINLVYIAKQN